jgi:hypothetical protein
MKKRSKMLAIIMVLTFALTGVGYAAWTDTLYINGSVSTGNLDVQFDGEPWLPADAHAPFVKVTKCEYNPEKNICTWEVGNLYPGAWVKLDVQQKNVGSIPAKFNKATLRVTDDPAGIANYLLCDAYFNGYRNPLNPWSGFGGIIQEDKPFKSLGTNMTNQLSNVVLDPGGWLNFDNPDDPDDDAHCIWIKMKENAPNTTQDSTITFELKMDWTQG